MQARLFCPTARQTNWLLIVGFLALGEALYLRYLAIEHGQVALACQAGLNTWLCTTFRLTIVLFSHAVFGWVALAAALLNLVRPSLVLVAVARRLRFRIGLPMPVSPLGRPFDPQLGATRSCTRMSATASTPAENHRPAN
jgi:type IV secretory pathway TrbD component